MKYITLLLICQGFYLGKKGGYENNLFEGCHSKPCKGGWTFRSTLSGSSPQKKEGANITTSHYWGPWLRIEDYALE